MAAILRRPGGGSRYRPKADPGALLGAGRLTEAVNGEIVSALDGNWLAGADPRWRDRPRPRPRDGAPAEISSAEMRKATLDSVRALMMIRAYRIRGHLAADLDPLRLKDPETHPELDPASYGFGPQDADRPIFIDNVLGLERATLNQIIAILKRTYCSTLGVEFMHISDPRQKAWIQERIEGPDKGIRYTAGQAGHPQQADRGRGLRALPQCQIHRHQALRPRWRRVDDPGARADHQARWSARFPGRFRHGPSRPANVLANVMAKPYSVIFHEFKGGSSTPEEVEGSGDVKYHLGSSSDREFDDNRVTCR